MFPISACLYLQSLLRLREDQTELEHRLSSLRREVIHVQDRNVLLEKSLSDETRIKLDLFSALGEAKRENEIVEGELIRKGKVILLTQCFSVITSEWRGNGSFPSSEPEPQVFQIFKDEDAMMSAIGWT